jgi:hypothetical protein
MGPFLSARKSIQPAAHWLRDVGWFMLATQLRTAPVSPFVLLFFFITQDRFALNSV